MNDLLWVRPWLWPLCFCALAVLLVVAWSAHRRRRLSAEYGAPSLERPQQAWPTALLCAWLALLMALAAMEPLYGKEEVQIERRGLDVLVCLDTSRSMLARDVEPDRLGRAKLDIKSLLPKLVGGDRIGLVAFAGEAKLVVPLTHDLDSFRELLAGVDTDAVRKGGTDLGAALDKALAASDQGHERNSAIVLLTDGEDLGGEGKKVAQKCAARGIVVHAIGYGSTQGARIVLPMEQGRGESFLKSGSGEEVISSLDTDGLRALCAVAGGDFLRADVVAEPFVEVFEKRLARLEKRSYDTGQEVLHKSRFQWLLVPALLLALILVWTTGGRR